jgi:hypothetical protein
MSNKIIGCYIKKQMEVVEHLTFGDGQIIMDDSKSAGAWQGASLTDVFMDNLEPDFNAREFAVNIVRSQNPENDGKGQLNDSGLYIVSYLADGKPKRNYKMGRGKDIGSRLASYKTYHAEEHSLRIHACLCMPAKTTVDEHTSGFSAEDLAAKFLFTERIVVLFENMCKNTLIKREGTVQIRNTETFGKGKYNSTMAYNLAILRQIWNVIGTALPLVRINLFVFNRRLWNASNKLMDSIPPLDHTLAVAPTAPPSALEEAMAAIGYDSKDKNDDLNAVLPLTFKEFLDLSAFHRSHAVTVVDIFGDSLAGSGWI